MDSLNQYNHSAPCRIAIFASPRSGNTWLRNLLSDALEIDSIAVHEKEDIQSIEERFILQLHTLPTKENLKFLSDHNFKVITITRHPLDILISVLRFAQFEPDVKRWVHGKTGAELLLKASPLTPKFKEYSVSKNFKTLLNVTNSWMPHVDACIKYEDLLNATELELTRVLKKLNINCSRENIANSISSNRLNRLKNTPNKHGWQGKKNNWELYINSSLAHKIFIAHKEIFANQGYDIIRLQTDLTDSDILNNWQLNAI